MMSAQTNRRGLLQMIGSLSAIPLLRLGGIGAAVFTGAQPARASGGRIPWLSGGTELITAAYPGDGIFETGNSCTVSLTRPTTRGPCYFLDDTGEDISLGLSGLPMQLCLRLIDQDCRPLAGHTVEVWHCDARGVYSGDTQGSRDTRGFRGSGCTRGDRAAQRSSWYRGKLVSNASGRVNFKTCFPGWYPGRTVHIHFAVSDDRGSDRVISQFCFSDELVKEICTTHPLYRERGDQDTALAGGWDPVFPARGYEDFVCKTRQNPDGTLLAYHTIQVV